MALSHAKMVDDGGDGDAKRAVVKEEPLNASVKSYAARENSNRSGIAL